MPPPTRQFGTYEVLEHIGSGGMGDVYHGRDPVLHRDVALKFLPEHLAGDPGRLQRFRREAQALAALNHPNIAQVFALAESGGRFCIVMELVAGETLADRIARGALPPEEGLRVARDIAEGLQAAHEKGVIHRDLKPANVKLTADGAVKVLDFGLAKISEPAGQPDSSKSPTLTASTRPNAVLGTPRYMSPEQARGAAVDHRADVFAFGSVVYEMLSGLPAFPGDTSTDVLASILAGDPDLGRLPARLNPEVRRLLSRCLQKEPRQRWQAMGDVRIEIESLLADPAGSFGRQTVARRARVAWPVTLAALIASAVTAAVVWRVRLPRASRTPDVSARRFSMDLGEVRPVISPDGRHIAYRLGGRLWIRDLDSETPREIPGGKAAGGYYTDNAYYLTWSPDSQSLVFPADGELRRVSIVQGGSATTLCTLPSGATVGRQVGGIAWSSDGDTIVFSRYGAGVFSVPARGGSPDLLWRQPHADDILLVETPHGRAILYAVVVSTGHTLMVRTPGGERRVVAELESNWPELVYSETGHVLFRKNPVESGSIWALPFSAQTLQAGGPPFLVERSGQGMSLAHNGTLVYLDTGRMGKQFLGWRDRRGNVLSRATDGHDIIVAAQLSANGHRAAVTAIDNGRSSLWLYDVEDFVGTPLELGGKASGKPVLFASWPRSGDEVDAAVRRDDPSEGTDVLAKHVDGGRPADWVPIPRGFSIPQDRSGDGRYLITYSDSQASGLRLWFFRAGANGANEFVNFSQNSEHEEGAELSPNGHYVAYTSTLGGELGAYVRPFPSGPGRWAISSGGGSGVRWSPDGTELFFCEGNKLMRVTVTTGPKFSVNSTPTPLFEHPMLRGTPAPFARYDVAPDGRRFLTVESQRDLERPIVRVIENWQSSFQPSGAR